MEGSDEKKEGYEMEFCLENQGLINELMLLYGSGRNIYRRANEEGSHMNGVPARDVNGAEEIVGVPIGGGESSEGQGIELEFEMPVKDLHLNY